MLKSCGGWGRGFCCHLRPRHLVDIYRVIQILTPNAEGSTGSDWYSVDTDVTGPSFGGRVDLLTVIVETLKVCAMNISERTEHSWHVTQRSRGQLPSAYIAVFFACSTGRHNINSHVKWSYTLLSSVSVCDSRHVLTAYGKCLKRTVPHKFSWLTAERTHPLSNQHASVWSFSLT